MTIEEQVYQIYGLLDMQEARINHLHAVINALFKHLGIKVEESDEEKSESESA